MPTAAIYCRQSFYKEDSCSIDMQVERSKAFCISQGWEYVVYDIDKGYSGRDTDRPGFRQMMKDITAGKINFVVVYKLDRISRNIRDFFGLMDEFNEREVGFRSLTENFDTTTPMGRASLGIVAILAQLERETTADRVRDNMLDRFRLGIWNGGPVPFGFRTLKTRFMVNGNEKTVSVLEPDATEIDYVRKFYEWYLEPQGSYLSNTKKANALGIPTKSGKAWNPNQMQRVMKNPLYCTADQAAYEYFSTLGIEMASKQSDFDGVRGLMWYNRRKPHKKTTRLKDQSEWVLAVGGHPGIIPGELYVKAQKKIADTTFRPARAGTGRRGLLASLIKCGKCGKSMIYSDHNGKWQYYKCRSKEHQGACVCSGQTVKGAELEQAVIDAIKSICGNKVFLEDIARQAAKNMVDNTEPHREEERRLRERLDALTTEQKELVIALGRKTMPAELIEERIWEIEKEKRPVLHEIEEVASKLENQDWQKIDMEMVFGNLLRFNEVFDEMEFEEKRNFLRGIIKEIVYTEGSIKISLYFLPEFTPDKLPTVNENHSTSVMHGCPLITKVQENTFNTVINIEETRPELPEDTMGQRLRKARCLKGLQIKEAAESAGVFPHTVSNWESGKREPKQMDKLKKLADVLDTTMEYILGPLPKDASFGERIKYWRKRKGLSQQAMAELIGVDRDTLADGENGRGKEYLHYRLAEKGMMI